MPDVKISLQQYADSIVAPQYRQPLKTIDEAMDSLKWERVDRPLCCGTEVETRSFIGDCYFAECTRCGKFMVEITGPVFRKSYAQFVDHDKVDTDTPRLWISGTSTEPSRSEG